MACIRKSPNPMDCESREFPADGGTLLGCWGCADLSVQLQQLRALPCYGALSKCKSLGAIGKSQNLDP